MRPAVVKRDRVRLSRLWPYFFNRNSLSKKACIVRDEQGVGRTPWHWFATGFSHENRLPPFQPFTSRYFQEPLKRLNRETSCSW